MSLYNMINGVQPETVFILPMLGKHPNEYPRFRDCVIGRLENSKTEKDEYGIPKHIKVFNPCERAISVYMRVGGGNRDAYNDAIEELRAIPEYITDYDDNFDSTYATFIFRCPKRWEKDFDLLSNGVRIGEISKAYKKQIDKVYPKLKGKLPWHKKGSER